MYEPRLFADCRCELGEGPFWHPLLKQLFWFDILNHTLFRAGDDGHIVDRFTFKDAVSAAAVIDADTLLIAQAGALLRYDVNTDHSEVIVEFEADLPANRPNDGRVNPAGGLWIGSMAQAENASTGTLYQYRGGVLTRILGPVGTPNSTCFTPDGRTAYFTDTGTKIIRKVSIDPATGLPNGEWSDYADTSDLPGWPDGSVVDAEGYLWNARYGGSIVVRFAPDGSVDRKVELPVSQLTCPALGGPDLKTLFVTSARQKMSPEQLEKEPEAGSIYAFDVEVPGQPDPLLVL